MLKVWVFAHIFMDLVSVEMIKNLKSPLRYHIETNDLKQKNVIVVPFCTKK